MFSRSRATLLATAIALSAATLASSANAQVTLFPGDHSVDGRLCVGFDCTGAETFGVEEKKISSI